VPLWWLGNLRCRLFHRHELGLLGYCIYCNRKLVPGDLLWPNEMYDPIANETHEFLTNPFIILEHILSGNPFSLLVERQAAEEAEKYR